MRQDPPTLPVPQPRAPYEQFPDLRLPARPAFGEPPSGPRDGLPSPDAGYPGYGPWAPETNPANPAGAASHARADDAARPPRGPADPREGRLLADLRREQRKVRRWLAFGVISLAGLLSLAGYAVATHQITSHLETTGPVVLLMDIVNIRLTTRRLASLRAAEASLLARAR